MFKFPQSKDAVIADLRAKLDAFERGRVSTPYTQALVDRHANDAAHRWIEVARLNRVVARQSAKIKRLKLMLNSAPNPAAPPTPEPVAGKAASPVAAGVEGLVEKWRALAAEDRAALKSEALSPEEDEWHSAAASVRLECADELAALRAQGKGEGHG